MQRKQGELNQSELVGTLVTSEAAPSAENSSYSFVTAAEPESTPSREESFVFCEDDGWVSVFAAKSLEPVKLNVSAYKPMPHNAKDQQEPQRPITPVAQKVELTAAPVATTVAVNPVVQKLELAVAPAVATSVAPLILERFKIEPGNKKTEYFQPLHPDLAMLVSLLSSRTTDLPEGVYDGYQYPHIVRFAAKNKSASDSLVPRIKWAFIGYPIGAGSFCVAWSSSVTMELLPNGGISVNAKRPEKQRVIKLPHPHKINSEMKICKYINDKNERVVEVLNSCVHEYQMMFHMKDYFHPKFGDYAFTGVIPPSRALIMRQFPGVELYHELSRDFYFRHPSVRIPPEEKIVLPPNAMTPMVLAILIERLFAMVAYFHACGLIHRDIKSENMNVVGNIFSLNPRWEDIKLYLYDPGLAIQVGRRTKGTSCGTLPFVAPEVFASEDATPAQDVVSAARTAMTITFAPNALQHVYPTDLLDEVDPQLKARGVQAYKDLYAGKLPNEKYMVRDLGPEPHNIKLTQNICSLYYKMLSPKPEERITIDASHDGARANRLAYAQDLQEAEQSSAASAAAAPALKLGV